MMADDLSWIDHPANLRANAALLRAIAEQSLLHADEIERLRSMLDKIVKHPDTPELIRQYAAGMLEPKP